MKICKTCKTEKSIGSFYKHTGMKDGHLNICIDCTKKRVEKHRVVHIDKIREYDRERGKLQHRIDQNSKNTKAARKRTPGYNAAHMAIQRALKNGTITKPLVCEWCGKPHSQIESHHVDYSKKLLVNWLCSPCHKILHLGKSKNTSFMRACIAIPF